MHKVVPVKNEHDHGMQYHVTKCEEHVAAYDNQKDAELHVQRLDHPAAEAPKAYEYGPRGVRGKR